MVMSCDIGTPKKNVSCEDEVSLSNDLDLLNHFSSRDIGLIYFFKKIIMSFFENHAVVKELKPNHLNFTRDQQFACYYDDLYAKLNHLT